MKAIDTTYRVLASAGITGAFFAMPLILATSWQGGLPELEVQSTAAPMVALAAVPMSLAPSEAVGDFGTDAADSDEAETGSTGTEGSGASEGTEARTTRTQTSVRKVGAGRSSVSTATAAPAPAKKRKRSCETPNPGIDRLGSDRFEVDRSIVDAYAKKPATLSALGWVNRHDGASGKADGFQVGGIRCGNDLHAAGLRNGDVVHAVNGRPVRSIPEAIWAYTKLRKADEIEVEITRKGARRTLTFQMV